MLRSIDVLKTKFSLYPAASIILKHNQQVLLVERKTKSFQNALVFPGGVVEEGDRDPFYDYQTYLNCVVSFFD